MKRFLFVALLAFLVLPIGFSLNCTYVDNYVTNIAYAANIGKLSFDNILNSLKVFQTTYTSCTGKGILVISGDSEYSYKLNGVYVGTFMNHIFLLGEGSYNVTAYGDNYLTTTKVVDVTGWDTLNFILIRNSTSSTSSSSGTGPSPNLFYRVDKSSILDYMNIMSSEINLSNSELSYQKKVYQEVPFNLKYVVSNYGNAKSVSYYFVNQWERPVNITVVLVIPKSISNTLNGIALTTGYKVIKADPIVEWNFVVKPNETKDFGYTFTSNSTEIEPPIILFNNVKLTSNNATNNTKPQPSPTPTPEPIVIPKANATNNTVVNNTKLISPKPHKLNYLPFIIGGVIAVGIGFTIFLFRRHEKYEELEDALDSLDKFVKTRRRR